MVEKFKTPLCCQVVRDKRTGKTKGYGFVSFKDPNDYVRAMREMNGKYTLSFTHHLLVMFQNHFLSPNTDIIFKKTYKLYITADTNY